MNHKFSKICLLLFSIAACTFPCLSSLNAGEPPEIEWVGILGSAVPENWNALVVPASTAVDSNSNVLTTGYFVDAIDFDPTLGEDVRAPIGLYNTYVTKLNADGSYAWTNTIGGDVGSVGKSVTTDEERNVIVTGFFLGTADFDPGPGEDLRTSNGNRDLFITKFGPDGSYQWTKTAGSPPPNCYLNGSDYGNGVVTDVARNVYVSGVFGGTVDFDPGPSEDWRVSNGHCDVFVTKFAADGNYLWTRAFGGPGEDVGLAIDCDLEEAIVISGHFEGTVDFDPGVGEDRHTSVDGFPNIFVTKFLQDGSYVWTGTMGGNTVYPGGYGVEAGRSVKIDPEGNVIVVGNFYNVADFNPGPKEELRTSQGESDIFVVKLNSWGGYLWAQTIGGIRGDGAYGVAVDSADNSILITGYFRDTVDFDPGPGEDFFTDSYPGYGDGFVTRLKSDGSYVWTRTMSGPIASYGVDLDIDSNGRLSVFGSFVGFVDLDFSSGIYQYSSQGGQDAFIIQLEPENMPPVLDPIGNKRGKIGDLLMFNVSASDPDSGVLILGVDDLPEGAQFEDHGNGTGTFSWVPTQSGSYDLTFWALDDTEPNYLKDWEFVTIIVNHPPQIEILPSDHLQTIENFWFPVIFAVSVSDFDGDPVDVWVDNLPQGASYYPEQGWFMWRPVCGQAGTHYVQVHATDGLDQTTVTVTIDVVHNPVCPIKVTPDLVSPTSIKKAVAR